MNRILALVREVTHMYKNILLAVDGSDNSLRAAKQAVQLADLSEGSHVIIIYVVDYDKANSEISHSYSLDDLNSERRKKLLPIEELLKKTKLSFEMKLLYGDPGPTIVSYANNNNADMLIIGSRGLNSFQEMVLGSVSHKVAKSVLCPVLIVK